MYSTINECTCYSTCSCVNTKTFTNLIIPDGSCCNILQHLNWLVVVFDYFSIHVAQVLHSVHLVVWITRVIHHTNLQTLYNWSLTDHKVLYWSPDLS